MYLLVVSLYDYHCNILTWRAPIKYIKIADVPFKDNTFSSCFPSPWNDYKKKICQLYTIGIISNNLIALLEYFS